MPFKDKLKQISHLTAAISSAVVMHSVPLSGQQDIQRDPSGSLTDHSATERLEQRVKRGTLINGETQEERSARWAAFKEKHGASATLEAIRQEPVKKIEFSQKDEDGYRFETYEPGKKRTYESYYTNGVLRAKSGKDGEEAEGYYPDGSKKFTRTADGVETTYHPGGEKGKEKIKETPHKLYEAYDVLDEEGRRIEHHHDVTDSAPHYDRDGSAYTARDVKKVDLYNPQTQEIVGTYTLDHWGVDEGRVASIGFVDESGVMKTMDFPQAQKNGDVNYYAHSLSLEGIKEAYQEEQQRRFEEQARQRGLRDLGVRR